MSLPRIATGYPDMKDEGPRARMGCLPVKEHFCFVSSVYAPSVRACVCVYHDPPLTSKKGSRRHFGGSKNKHRHLPKAGRPRIGGAGVIWSRRQKGREGGRS